MKTFAELQQQEQALQEQLRQTRMDKIRARAAETRVQERATMSPEAIAAAHADDQALAEAFAGDAGAKALAVLQKERPVVADRIGEALARVAALTP